MKILLDECLPVRLKNLLKEYEVFSVSENGMEKFEKWEIVKSSC